MRIERLGDVRMDEVHLTTPVPAEAIRQLKLGDVVYISGALYTARVHPDGRVEFRTDPQWFTDYYRRTGIE